MAMNVKVAPEDATNSDSGFIESVLLKILAKMLAKDLAQRLGRAAERGSLDDKAIEDARHRIFNAECSLADYEPDPGFEEKESLIRVNLERLVECVGKVNLGHVGHGTDASIIEVQRAFEAWRNSRRQRVLPRASNNNQSDRRREKTIYYRYHTKTVEVPLRFGTEQVVHQPQRQSRKDRRLAAVQRRYRIEVAQVRARAAARPTPQAQRGELVKALNSTQIEVAEYKKALADFKRPPKQFWNQSRAVFQKGVDDKNVPSKKNKKQQQQQQKGGKKNKQKKGQTGPS